MLTRLRSRVLANRSATRATTTLSALVFQPTAWSNVRHYGNKREQVAFRVPWLKNDGRPTMVRRTQSASGSEALRLQPSCWRPEVKNEIVDLEGLMEREKWSQDYVDDVLWKSPKYLQWQCGSCRFKWSERASIRNNPQSDAGCPQCSGTKLLLEHHPNIAAEWDLKSNHTLTQITIETVPMDSPCVVWWTCVDCESGYLMATAERVAKGHDACPQCAKTKNRSVAESVLKFADEGALLSTMAGLYAECRAPNKDELEVDSLAIVPWCCSTCGHSYSMRVSHRCRRQKGCPECEGEDGTKRHNLILTRPDIYDEIIFYRSFDKRMSVKWTTKSTKVALFGCKVCRAQYRMSIRERCHASVGCPKCFQMKVSHRIQNPTLDAYYFPNARLSRTNRRPTKPTVISLDTYLN